MRKYFLSSMLIMGLIAPAFGADGVITGGAGTCTVDVLGVSDNNATANTIATWALNDYECGAGQYLDEDTLTCTTCPVGSYCPGGTYTVENAESGTNTCPTGYENSDAGASADTQCYTDCKVSDIAHATAVTGNDYYGTGTDTCTATDCELGYHVDGDLEIVEKEPVVDIDTKTITGAVLRNGNGEEMDYGLSDVTLTENNTGAAKFDNGVLYFRASCQPAENSTFGYLGENEEAVESGDMSMDELIAGLTAISGPAKANLFVKLAGMDTSNLTEEEAEELEGKLILALYTENNVDYSTASTGTYCYVRADAFQPNGGTKSALDGTQWVIFPQPFGTAEECAVGCIDSGAFNVIDDDLLRLLLLGAVTLSGGGSGMCLITESNCPAGTYFRKTSTTLECVPCPAGSFCPGGLFTIDSTTNGENACPAGYPKSDVGASADTQCYKNCEVSDIPHATAVAGNDYYGTGVDSCVPTKCQTGYHVDGGGIELVEKDPLIPVDYTLAGNDDGYISADSNDTYQTTEYGLTANNTWASEFDYGVIYGKASCQPKADAGNEYIFSNIAGIMGGTIPMETVRSELEIRVGASKAEVYIGYLEAAFAGGEGMSEEEKITAVKKYMAVGIATDGNYTTDSSGQYCYCQMDGFMPTGGTKAIVTSAPWVFLVGIGSADDCASLCARNCAYNLRDDGVAGPAFRAAVVGALDLVESSEICAANTINIDWNPDNGGEHTQNMCMYDGAITLPDDPVKPGFTFAGWKLVE